MAKKYSKVQTILKMTHKVPKSTQKYMKLRGAQVYLHSGTTKVAKNIQNEQKVPKKYSKVQKSTQNYS